MDSSTVILAQALRQRLGEDFQLAGPELDYLVRCLAVNLTQFSDGLPSLLLHGKWQEIGEGSRLLRAAADNLQWAALSEATLALQEAARQSDATAAAAAVRQLRAVVKSWLDNDANSCPPLEVGR